MKLRGIKTYFAANGVEDGTVYSHGCLCGEIQGIEETDGVWQTYYALPREKASLSRHATFEDAAKWVIEKATKK